MQIQMEEKKTESDIIKFKDIERYEKRLDEMKTESENK